ncbi:putative formin-like protein 7 [Iris pallida]|uniref:Formin-like protein 7 n=1 Tax=Iris pallida TaxID=29817 RepID=A0AAX6II00_IRIPA|nr:putative formin-like protein 7 [Iris pallida]
MAPAVETRSRASTALVGSRRSGLLAAWTRAEEARLGFTGARYVVPRRGRGRGGAPPLVGGLVARLRVRASDGSGGGCGRSSRPDVVERSWKQWRLTRYDVGCVFTVLVVVTGFWCWPHAGMVVCNSGIRWR